MGAAASLPFHATHQFMRQIDSNYPTFETVDICLACEKDSYPPGYLSPGRNISELKELFREFMRSVLPTDKYTVFRWSTWDTDNADIVIPREDVIVARRRNVADRYLMPQRHVFDAVISMQCPFPLIDNKSLSTMCSLLKPWGLVVVFVANHRHDSDIPRSLSVRDEPLGDCSDDTRGDNTYRLRQVYSVTNEQGQHFTVWQKYVVLPGVA